MNDKSEDLQKEETEDTIPDEQSGFYFSSFLKIHDPNSKEILVQTRGDN
jgi:hypothetical protein